MKHDVLSWLETVKAQIDDAYNKVISDEITDRDAQDFLAEEVIGEICAASINLGVVIRTLKEVRP